MLANLSNMQKMLILAVVLAALYYYFMVMRKSKKVYQMSPTPGPQES